MLSKYRRLYQLNINITSRLNRDWPNSQAVFYLIPHIAVWLVLSIEDAINSRLSRHCIRNSIIYLVFLMIDHKTAALICLISI